jgi:hypothetical protein
MAAQGMIEILLEEYEALRHALNKLLCLEGAGVDNWEGYDSAMEMLEEMEGV